MIQQLLWSAMIPFPTSPGRLWPEDHDIVFVNPIARTEQHASVSKLIVDKDMLPTT
jgi:hypothetical protein